MPCLSITAVMLMLFSFFDILNQWEDRHLEILAVIRWIIRRTPVNLFEMLPFSALLASMVTAFNWVQHGEWTIIRFAGWRQRHSLIFLILAGAFLGGVGLFADTLNARKLGGIDIATKSVWVHSAGYIFKIAQVNVTGFQSAELDSVYVYPDSASVLQGTAPSVQYLPHASLNNNLLTFDPSIRTRLPSKLALPFYLVLEPSTLERLDIAFLIRTLNSVKNVHQHATSTEAILNFTLAKKCFYSLWIMYWLAWGNLLLLIPPRFRNARTYQAGIFALGSLLIFCYRTLSTVLMQQEFSGWWMNSGMLFLGIIGLFALDRLIRWKTAGG